MRIPSLLLLIFIAVPGPSPSLLAQSGTGSLEKVVILPLSEGRLLDRDKHPMLNAGEALKLHAGLVVDRGKEGRHLFTDARLTKPPKGIRQVKKLGEFPGQVTLEWFKLEPARGSYSSRDLPLEWARTPWKKGDGVITDVHPTLLPDQFPSLPTGLGVMRFQLEVRSGDRVLTTPGLKPGKGTGLDSGTLRVTYLPVLDAWLPNLFALVNSPYMWGNLAHHADDQLASDCADFIVAAWRRAGHLVPYTNSWGLRDRKYTNPAHSPTISGVDGEGFYLDKQGRRIKLARDQVHIGDVVLWKRHVGVLLKDWCGSSDPTVQCEGNGYLDSRDLVIHTLFAPPKVEGIGRAYGTPLQILRPRW